MSADDFDALKQTPPAREDARARALAAAMAAFDQAAPERAAPENSPPPARAGEGFEEETKKIDAAPQGSGDVVRLSDRRQERTALMNRIFRNKQMMAASLVAILAVPAAVVAWREIEAQRPPPQQDKSAMSRVMPERPASARAAQMQSAAPATASGALATPPAPQATPNQPLQSAHAGRGEEKRRAVAASELSAEAAPAAPPTANAAKQETLSNLVSRWEPPRENGIRPQPAEPAPAEPENREKFETRAQNAVKQVAQEPVSTFSLDVDTAAYALIRRDLMARRKPPEGAVRVEEMINYFPYAYPAPASDDPPFMATFTVAPSPWNAGKKLVHVAVKGFELKAARPRANLVLLIDTSGSMSGPDRLELVKNGFKMLLDELAPEDTVAIVTYANGSGVALEPTKIAQKGKILAALDALRAGGSTAGANGIEDAYRLAQENFDKKGVNRILLATDGDFNVGVTNPDALKRLIEDKRKSGVYLSIIGVGRDNYNDALMQKLAQNGNGVAAYADTLNEARKILVDQASSMLFPIADDVKIQVEWNPARVSEYRLVGYEKRLLKREDFNNDKVDAGEIGSGHSVTAIYEIAPRDADPGAKSVDDLRYGGKADAAGESQNRRRGTPPQELEYGFLKLRYKQPGAAQSKLMSAPIDTASEIGTIDGASEDARFSVAVAGFGQLLRGGEYLSQAYGYDDVVALAEGAKGRDAFGYRAEFVNLARLAKGLK